MSRKFSPREAKALAANAKVLFQGLDAAASSLDDYDLSVSNAIRESRERKVKRILKEITLETIEDETRAYDIAKLRSAGFRTALDVYDAQHGGPSQVNGHPSTARIVEECANRARAGVRLSLDPGKRTPETDAVILTVYARLKAGPLVNECKRLARDARSYSPDVDKELGAATGTIRWLFASRQNKETAEEACERLSCLLDGGFGKKAHSVLNDLSALYGVSPETTWAEFATDANAYLSVVGNAEPGCIGSDDWGFSSTDAGNAIAKATALSGELDAARSYLPKIDLRIKESVNTYLAKELLDTLAGASVDEMARSKQGIRTKPLRDAGYKTLADVYTASLYDLESVHGIGESMASSAKRFTQQYAAEARKGLRLRLSTDRKTPEATAVVGLVYARLRAEPLVDKCEHLAPNVLSEMDAASHGLLLARNPEKWLFASKTEIASASEAYDRLRGFLDNAGGKEARDALRRLEALNKTSTDIYTTRTDAACTDFSAAPVTQRLLLLLRHIAAWADFSATQRRIVKDFFIKKALQREIPVTGLYVLIFLFVDRSKHIDNLCLLLPHCCFYGLVVPVPFTINNLLHFCVCSDIFNSFWTLCPVNSCGVIKHDNIHITVIIRFNSLITLILYIASIIHSVTVCTTICMTVITATILAASTSYSLCVISNNQHKSFGGIKASFERRFNTAIKATISCLRQFVSVSKG